MLVAFRKMFGDTVSDKFALKEVPVGALGQIRIGSIWQNDRSNEEAIFDPQEFKVDFTSGRWRFTSFENAIRNYAEAPFPLELYPLKYPIDRNWLIEFELPQGGRLLIPCTEFFARCFGFSSEVRRILATYRWDGPGHDTAMYRFFAPLDCPEEPAKWQVRLRKRLYDDDAVFLAHAKYDMYTQRVAKTINADLAAHFVPNQASPAFLKIGPWFQGPATIAVEGIPFNEKKSFLALRVLGMTEPIGSPIFLSRENSSDAENPAPEGSPEAWAGAPDRVLLEPPDCLDLTGDLSPDHDAGEIEVQDVGFRIIGQRRPVVKIRADQATTKAGPKSIRPDATIISGGEAHGSGKGVAYASIHAVPIFESAGMLFDMWSAMVNLKETRPDLIRAVSWFTIADGYGTSEPPKLNGIEPFKDSDDATSTARRFPFLDQSIPLLRGVLVVRLLLSDGPTYIVEIMRKPRKITTDDGEVKEAEESFQGLVFRLQNENQLVPWLRELLARIRHEDGVFKRLTGSCPGTADSFSHRHSKKLSPGCLPCEHMVIAALDKLKPVS
ncbi:hypothetical protein PO883_26835 [Massilia sp. DJPM01]|uniref:hypothetical protein n=1 Tax=Massilia sp. DJPM01 TaxID=3024404 RepID=UPI00259EBF34|nr:hypothetical protein [Massilia sp. DJPM01]MDM5180804.1 hypothetical protein [Massilia sp. DJPM01]